MIKIKPQVSDNSPLSLKNCKLNGITLFRFAHAFKDPNSGGVEQYLFNLNRALLKRNKMTIIQMHLVNEDSVCNVEIENIGQGKLIWVPSIKKKYEKRKILNDMKFINLKNSNENIFKLLIKQSVNVFKNFIRIKNKLNPHYFSVSNYNIIKIFDDFKIDLSVFHWISFDSEYIIQKSIQKKIPFLIVNHFENKRYDLRLVKRQISQSVGLGGVSNINVPNSIRNKFTYLSDGIDTEFFNPENARFFNSKINGPIIFLPSRIEPNKGHIDIVRAFCLIKDAVNNAKLVFAGNINSIQFSNKLISLIEKLKIQNDVIFLGQISLENLRDWYALSDIVVLPSYTEGLPRILLEAQSMQKPVVAYDVGGVCEITKNKETGFLVKKGNYKNLAYRIIELLQNDEKRIQMGVSGRKFVLNNFDFLSLVKRHEEFYFKALTN